MTGPRYVSLCTGYGGLDDGARRVFGGKLAAYAEVKAPACALLAAKYPGVPNLGDLTVADWTGVEAEIVTAGWPCQPWAMGGRRLGELDPRAILPKVVEVVRVVRPTVFVGENVAHAVKTGEIARAVELLEALGYVVSWVKREARQVGAPHRRARVFLVAVDPAQGLPEVLAGPGPRLFDADDLVLLPTPEEKLKRSGADYARAARPSSGGDDLITVLARLLLRSLDGAFSWREYGPALERWASVIGRPAPPGLQAGLRAPHAPQLSQRFTEWVMGLDEGLVTDGPLGVSKYGERAAALSLLGDGVVPLQAELGVRDALASVVLPATAPAVAA